MASLNTLTRHDANVLDKIKDPESEPSHNVVIDPSLPRDPHVTDAAEYDRLARHEQEALVPAQRLELQLAGLLNKTVESPVDEYKRCIAKLGEIIETAPQYASARNNRVQALRRLYGDGILVCQVTANALVKHMDESEAEKIASLMLNDLDAAIALLTPSTPFASLSSRQARTLSLLHTQRAALYHETSKWLPGARVNLPQSRRESNWARLEFEEAASRDFALGGRFGCDIAKGLAVSTNPTAKLCGQIVREAMKKEYGPDFNA